MAEGDIVKALQAALAEPPYETRTAAVKVAPDARPHPPPARRGAPCAMRRSQDAAYAVVDKPLHQIKDATMGSIVEQLSLDECDVLMKYIYFGCAPNPPPPRTRTRARPRPPAAQPGPAREGEAVFAAAQAPPGRPQARGAGLHRTSHLRGAARHLIEEGCFPRASRVARACPSASSSRGRRLRYFCSRSRRA